MPKGKAPGAKRRKLPNEKLRAATFTDPDSRVQLRSAVLCASEFKSAAGGAIVIPAADDSPPSIAMKRKLLRRPQNDAEVTHVQVMNGAKATAGGAFFFWRIFGGRVGVRGAIEPVRMERRSAGH